MSREAWSDEGNVANHWEETLIRVELDRVVKDFDQWNRDNGSDMPNPEFVDLVRVAHSVLAELQEALTGKI